MSLRGFGPQTLAGTPQPLLGWQTTAAFRPSPDLYTGRLDPGSQSSSSLVPLGANTGYFRVGDHVLLGASNTFSQTNTTPPDGGTVQQVNLSASNILVTGLMRNHSASEWCILALPASQVQIQVPTANTGALIYLGEDNTVSATSQTLIAEIPKGTLVPPFSVPQSAGGSFNTVETQRLWVQGTTADTYLPSILGV